MCMFTRMLYSHRVCIYVSNDTLNLTVSIKAIQLYLFSSQMKINLNDHFTNSILVKFACASHEILVYTPYMYLQYIYIYIYIYIYHN